MSPNVIAESRPQADDESPACLQARLEQSALVTSRLCHDFGNYLTGIMGFTELGLTQAAPDSIQQRFLNEVLTSARQGAEWIRRLHLFCRRGGAKVWPAPLSCVVAEAAANAPGLRWTVNVPADLPLLAMDAASLQTVLTELANNTRDATQGQGTISIAAQRVELADTDCREVLGSTQPGPHVEIVVADDGPGFAPDVRARLFRDIFLSTKPRHRGLGLLVVYGTLHRFRGGLKLDAPAATTGAPLRLYVPITDIAGPALTAGADQPRVLLVHATVPLFTSMRKILEARSCAVEMAAALDSSAPVGQVFTLIVIETALAQVSGFDLAHRILMQDPKANFLFVHTHGSSQGLAEEELLKRFPMVRSPLEPESLLQAIQAALGRTPT